MDKKIKVLVVPSDQFGVGLYRSVSPHTQLDKLYGDEFDVEINYNPPWSNHEFFDKYDIIHIHKGLYDNFLIIVRKRISRPSWILTITGMLAPSILSISPIKQ